jgi:hypothetical protein
VKIEQGERRTSDLSLDVAALVAEAALPLAQLLLRRRLWLQKALHRLHPRREPRRSSVLRYGRKQEDAGATTKESLP